MNRTGRAYHRVIGIWLTCAICIGLYLYSSAITTGQQQGSLTFERSITPASGELETVEFTVTLTITGNISQCPPSVSSRPVDILLVIDRSPSMYDPAGGGTSGTKMDLLKPAARRFLANVDLTRDRVGLVEFDGVANVSHPLSNDAQSLEVAIDGIRSGSSTSVDQGVLIASREFQSDRARPDTSQVMVLLTDGGSDKDRALRAAAAAQQAGIRLITIALGSDADQDLLRAMASQDDDFYVARQASDLDQIYATIAQTVIQPPVATDLVVQHMYDASALEIVPDSLSPPGVVDGNTLTWTSKEVLTKPITLSYRVRPRVPGTIDVDRGDTIRYNQCGTTPQQIDQPPGLPVVIQPPPTATPTPTPLPTFTPAPTPLPTATPTVSEQFQQTLGTAVCDAGWWPWLLGLLLLLFAIWWLMQVIREWRRPAHERQPCRWLPWLFVPLALILAAFIFAALSPLTCGAHEALYFWRINSGERDGRIFVTDRDGTQPVREFAAVNQGACSGCHAVSSTGHRISSVIDGATGPVVVHSLDGRSIPIPSVNGSYTAWSPDGTKLAVATDAMDIVIVDITTQVMTRLTGASDPTIPEMMPSWSPNGQHIAFVRGTTAENAWTFSGPCDIYVVPASGGTATPLVGASGSGFNYYPAYSPDGRWLAFTHHETGITTYAAPEAEIFIVPADGGNRIRLAANDAPDGTPLQRVSNSWPTWSLDGEWLAFTSKRNDPAYDIFMTQIDANGNTGPATPIPSAAVAGVFEHLPFWGVPPRVNPWATLLGLWPCLIPFALIALAWWICTRLHRAPAPQVPAEAGRIPPGPLPTVSSEPFWQVAPTLIVGVGGTGRWVLTHVKKTLRDGGAGVLPERVRFILVDTSERETTNLFRDAAGNVTNVAFAGVSLAPEEMLLMGQNLASSIQQVRTTPDVALETWFPSDHYRTTLASQEQDLAAGTGGRRPLARAGLIGKLRQGLAIATAESPAPPANDAAHLWHRLVQASEQVRDGKLVRIIVVGSLAGGMSGIISDLAYLSRRAALRVVPADGTVHIEGYFTTPGAFQAVAGEGYARLQINALATAREVQRFQLSTGLPFPFDYREQMGARPEAEQAYMAQECDWKLFDDITLFGGNAHPERGSDKSDQLWATTFASMADVISFRLDQAIRAGDQGDFRATVRTSATTKQQQSGQAVVSSAGSYVYRLPLVDILELVHTRWARKLYHVFLNGDVEGSSLALDPAQARMPVSPHEYARTFLLAEHPAGEPPRGMRTVGSLVAGQLPAARDVQALLRDEGQPFTRYLARGLSLILNGNMAGSGTLDRRVPRLAYARAFCEALMESFRQALQTARAQQGSAPATSGTRSWWRQVQVQLGHGPVTSGEWLAVISRLQNWSELVRRSFESLGGAYELLAASEATGGVAAARGLYQELARRQTAVEQRRAQMDQVAVRRYLWSRPIDPDRDPAEPANQEDLADVWYHHIEADLTKYLDRFYWYMAPDGTIRLGVVTFNDLHSSVALDDRRPETVAFLADELLKLAAFVTAEHHLGRELTLRNVLPTQLSTRFSNPEDHLIEHIWSIAQPHLEPARDANYEIDGFHTAAAGLPLTIQQDAQFAGLKQGLDNMGNPRMRRISAELNPCPTQVIATTDRTALTIIREHTLMPLLNLPELQAAWQTYLCNAGSRIDPLVEPVALTTVFAAEQHALAYECRFEAPALINTDFHLLHPLIVLALARAERATLYALAFAAGWVEVRGGTAWLHLPDGNEVALASRLPTSALDARVSGLLYLALEAEAGLITMVQTALHTPTQSLQQAWQQFIARYRPVQASVPEPVASYCAQCGQPLSPGVRFCGECGHPVKPRTPPPAATGAWQPPFAQEAPALRDLAAIAALAVARQLAPNNWDQLVMQRSRKCPRR